MLSELRVYEFLQEVAGPEAAPGGGTAAALAGAQGAALISMVCRLTLGRKKYAEAAAEMAAALERTETLRQELIELMDRDASAYDGVMAAYKLPKETPQEQAARQAAIQQGLQQAARVPLETLAACVETLELAPAVLARGNPNVISDGGAGVLSAHAGMMAALLNVVINLNAITDALFVATARSEMEALRARGDAARATAWAAVCTHLGL